MGRDKFGVQQVRVGGTHAIDLVPQCGRRCLPLSIQIGPGVAPHDEDVLFGHPADDRIGQDAADRAVELITSGAAPERVPGGQLEEEQVGS